MGRKVVLYIAASLDGFIADANNGLDWLLSAEGEGDNGFSEFYQTVDTVLLGRKTYDWIRSHEGGAQPYADKEVYVFSNSRHGDAGFVSLSGADLVEFVRGLKAAAGSNIWLVGGGELISQFLNAGLVDQLQISIAPVILGSGIPLFKNIMGATNLTLTNLKQHGQFTELCYDIRKDARTPAVEQPGG